MKRLADLRYRLRSEKRNQRGAALVEFSIVATLIMTLAIGTYEMGMAWNDAQLVTQAARSGARVGAQLGSDNITDQRIMEAVEAGLGSLESNLVKVVIYDASATDGSVPPSCLTGNHPGSSGTCSIYDYSHFASFSQGAWAPASRLDELENADYLGVYVEVDRPLMTGFFGTAPLTIIDSAIMRVEPRFEP